MDSTGKDESERTSRRVFLAGLASVSGAIGSGCIGGMSRQDEEEEGNPKDIQDEQGSAVTRVSPRVPKLVWDHRTDGTVLSTPVLSNGVAYVGSYDGYLYAFEGSSETGSAASDDGGYPMYKYDRAGTNAPAASGPRGDVGVRWRFPTDGRVSSTPAVVGENVYFGSEDNYFYSVSSESGEENWRYDSGRRIGMGGSPTVTGGVVYFSSGHSGSDSIPNIQEGGGVHALDAETGDEIWEIERDKGVQSPPLVYNGLLYHGCQDNSLYAVDAETGEEVWSYEADGVFCGTRPSAKDGVVYSGNLNNSMYALDADDGSLVWEFETGDVIVSSPVATENGVYFGSNDHHLYAVNPETGEEIWSFDATNKVYSSPAYRDGVVYVGAMGGKAYAVNGRTGEEVWKVRLDQGYSINSSPVVTEDMVYFGTEQGTVYGIQNQHVTEDEYDDEDSLLTIDNREL
jgi:outer membrane protein assembly factor BamB